MPKYRGFIIVDLEAPNLESADRQHRELTDRLDRAVHGLAIQPRWIQTGNLHPMGGGV